MTMCLDNFASLSVLIGGRGRLPGGVRLKYRSLFCVLILGFSINVAASESASANGLSENRSWQFNTSADRANKSAVRSLIERRKDDGFRTIYNSYSTSTTTNFDVQGDYVDCAVTATTTANSNTSSQSATIGSPSVGVVPSFNAQADGNVSDSSASGSGTNSNNGNGGGTSATNNVDQTNSAPQTANVDSNDVDTDIGSSSGSGTGGTSAINSTQTADGAVLNANVTDSAACAFVKKPASETP